MKTTSKKPADPVQQRANTLVRDFVRRGRHDPGHGKAPVDKFKSELERVKGSKP